MKKLKAINQLTLSFDFISSFFIKAAAILLVSVVCSSLASPSSEATVSFERVKEKKLW